MLDTKGPEIRTGYLVDGKNITIEKDSIVEITTDYTVDVWICVDVDQGRLSSHLVFLQGPPYFREAQSADLRVRWRPDLPGRGDRHRVVFAPVLSLARFAAGL